MLVPKPLFVWKHLCNALGTLLELVWKIEVNADTGGACGPIHEDSTWLTMFGVPVSHNYLRSISLGHDMLAGLAVWCFKSRFDCRPCTTQGDVASVAHARR